MNIFALDNDPVQAAQMQCDKHVVKMVLETGQMLSTIQRGFGNDDPILYRPTHVNHPCTRWAAASAENYDWLVAHFDALADEYTYRYDKQHLTHKKLADVTRHAPTALRDKHAGLSPFALAMPDKYKSDDPVHSYRWYYLNDKANILYYTKRQRPRWLADMVTDVIRRITRSEG